MHHSSIQSSAMNNLSTQIEGLIDVVMQLASPTMHQQVYNLSPIETHPGSENSHVANLSHTNVVIDFFHQYPFHISMEYINHFILPLYSTLDDVFSSSTLSLHAVTLIINLNQASRLDDYEHFEEDLITFFGFIQYCKDCHETLTYGSFNPKEFANYLYDQYFHHREKVASAALKLRLICQHNSKTHTTKYRARTASASKPTVGFASPVQGGYTEDQIHEEEEKSSDSPPTFRGIPIKNGPAHGSTL